MTMVVSIELDKFHNQFQQHDSELIRSILTVVYDFCLSSDVFNIFINLTFASLQKRLWFLKSSKFRVVCSFDIIIKKTRFTFSSNKVMYDLGYSNRAYIGYIILWK